MIMDIDNIKYAVIREASRRSLADFVRIFWRTLEPTADLKWGWYLDVLCHHLELVSKGEITKLVINVPPGSMKSLMVSVMWPSWEWAVIDPSLQIIGVAHNTQLSSRDSKKMRRLVESDLYRKCFPHVKLAKDQNSKLNFETTKFGQRWCVAYKNMTGARGDRVIIDDPLTVEDGMSKAAITEAARIFNETVPTRINGPKSAIIMIMQRIHESDPAACALADESYDRLIVPMEYDPSRNYNTKYYTDPRTKEGELFFPERFGPETVQKLKERLGPYASASQLQQTPQPRTGGYLDASKIEVLPSIDPLLHQNLIKVRGWDLAATEGAGDYTVGALLGYDNDAGNVYILNIKRGQWNAADVDRMIKSTAVSDGKTVEQSIPIDPAAAGKRAADQYVTMLMGYPVHTSREEGSKEARARALSSAIHAKRVFLINNGLTNTVLDEFNAFPVGSHDDIVDAVSRAFNRATESLTNTFDIQGLL